MGGVVAWTGIFTGKEAVLAFNTHLPSQLTVFVPVDSGLHHENDIFILLFSLDGRKNLDPLALERRDDLLTLHIEVPDAGCFMYMKTWSRVNRGITFNIYSRVTLNGSSWKGKINWIEMPFDITGNSNTSAKNSETLVHDVQYSRPLSNPP